jgi:DNA-binding transcriptional LysR family regulator
MEAYQAFAAVVEKRGLTAAARHLRRSPQSVSRSMVALERDIGVELVRHTTRQSRPTDAASPSTSG